MINFFKIIFRGIGQVMLQNNILTGVLFFIGILFNSWLLAVGAILGNIIGTTSAILLKYPQNKIDEGLFGFNGTLVGIAILFLFKLNIYTFIIIIIGSILSTIMMYEIDKREKPAYTSPFCISTWIMILLIGLINLAPFLPSSLDQYSFLNIFSATTMGLGQVMFQGNVITGLIFLLAILINSRISAIYALYGSILGTIFAIMISLPLSAINIGLFGYNAVLCGIALGGKKFSSFIYATIAIIISVLLNYWLKDMGIITLTAPFVLSTWVLLILKKYLKFKDIHIFA